MDWKFDNIGKCNTNYKLFDFDSSGLIDLHTNAWLIKPLHMKSYDSYRSHINEYKKRIGTAGTAVTPKEMDDWSFEYNLLDRR